MFKPDFADNRPCEGGRRPPLANTGIAFAIFTCSLLMPVRSDSIEPSSISADAKESVTFAKHSKLTAQPAEQAAIRRFFRDVLGVQQARESAKSDIFRLGPQFYLGVIYDEDAPTADAMRKAIWLELATADTVKMKAKIIAGGGKEVDYRDKQHFYFQAPGGQVFRLISHSEDTSQWER